jgi:hypothetical protein
MSVAMQECKLAGAECRQERREQREGSRMRDGGVDEVSEKRNGKGGAESVNRQ